MPCPHAQFARRIHPLRTRAVPSEPTGIAYPTLRMRCSHTPPQLKTVIPSAAARVFFFTAAERELCVPVAPAGRWSRGAERNLQFTIILPALPNTHVFLGAQSMLD